ncbi:unnamed protein product, partial [Musa textilis]
STSIIFLPTLSLKNYLHISHTSHRQTTDLLLTKGKREKKKKERSIRKCIVVL